MMGRKGAITAFVVIFIVSLVGATRLEVTDDAAEGMLPTDAESVARYEDFLQRFPSDQGALVVFENLLCSEDGWELIKRAERDFRQHPFIDRTISLASPSARYIVTTDEGIDLSRFRDVDFPDGESRCKAATEYAPFANILVSDDGYAAAMFLVAEGGQDAVTFAREMESIFSPLKAEALNIQGKMLLTGEPIMSAELSRVVAKDSALVLGLILIMMVIMYAITRSLLAVSVSLSLNIFVATCSYGYAGWSSSPLTPSTSLVVFLLIPLSTAFVIHAYGYVVRSNRGETSLQSATTPCLLAGITTGIGFACTGLTSAPDIQNLAVMGLIGILSATVGVFLFVLPTLSLSKNTNFVLNFSVPRWPIVRPQASYFLILLLILVAGIGLWRLQVAYEPTEYLPDTNPKKMEFNRAGAWFGRMNIPLQVNLEQTSGIEAWRLLSPLVDQLNTEHPQSFQIIWLADHLKELYNGISGEELQLSSPAIDHQTFEQLLLWFDPEDLELYLDDKRERQAIWLQVPFLSSLEYFEMKETIDSYLAEHKIAGDLTGRAASFFETGHEIGLDNIRGLAIGAAVIFVVLLLLFRSIRFAAIGLSINALPVLASLGVLGLVNVPLDLGSSIVAAIAFGIVLDDSTHLLSRTKQLLDAAYDPVTAVLRATRELIAPIITTTLVICSGFLILLGAEVKMFHDFAILILTTMFTALIADVVILPALVRQFIKDPLSAGDAARSW